VVLVKQRVGTRIVTHRGPTSPPRHEPHHQAIANYWCTLISEEPGKGLGAGRAERDSNLGLQRTRQLTISKANVPKTVPEANETAPGESFEGRLA
jgi:hypothetical protein